MNLRFSTLTSRTLYLKDKFYELQKEADRLLIQVDRLSRIEEVNDSNYYELRKQAHSIQSQIYSMEATLNSWVKEIRYQQSVISNTTSEYNN